MEKRKKYFVLGAVGSIILSFISILLADSSLKKMQDFVSKVPGAVGERMSTVYNSSIIFIVPAVLCIIFCIIILLIALTNKLEDKRNLVFGLCIAIFVLSPNSFVTFLSIAGIVGCSGIKSVRKEKKEIPNVSRYSSGIKGVIGAVLCFLIYFSQAIIPDFNSYFISIIIYLIVLGLLILIFWDNLKRDVGLFIKNFSGYISFILPRLGIMYLIYFVVSLICIILNKDISINQQQIEALPVWYSFPLAAILAPIVEEILFRGCIRRFIKNDVIFIIVSGLIFGLLHTISEGSLFSTIIMAIPYSILGWGFAYIYVKTNNITNNILCHSFHNTVVSLLQMMF